MCMIVAIPVCIMITALATYFITFQWIKCRIKNYLVGRILLMEGLFDRQEVLDILIEDL
jgi:hypothetical protein